MSRVSAQIDRTTHRFIVCRRSAQGLLMKVDHEHGRLAPSGDLAKKLAQGTLEDEFDQTPIPDLNLNDTQEQMNKTNLNFNYSINDNDKNGAVLSSLLTNEEPIGASEHDLATLSAMMKPDSNELQSLTKETLGLLFKFAETTQATRKGMQCAPP